MIGSNYARRALAGVLCAIVVGTSIAEEDAVVAVVNGHEIRMSHVYEQIESVPLGDQLSVRQNIPRFIESLIQEEVLFQSMLESNFAAEPELRDEIKGAVVEYLVERHVSAHKQVSDQEVADYYEQNTSAIRGESVRASQILRDDKQECIALSQQIDSPEVFARLARQQSLHEDSREKDGDIGYFMNHNGPLGFETELFEMAVDEMRVFETEDGCHLVRITEHELPPLPPLENVAPRVRALLELSRERKLLRALLERSEPNVEVERRPLPN